jgi:subtilase family serine protease
MGTRSLLGLAAGTTNSATTAFAVPATGLSEGKYYLCAITDLVNAVTESNETNNTKCSSGAYQIGPDLSVSSISGSLSGTTLYVSDAETNKGNQPAAAFSVSFYLSSTTAPDPSTDTPLGTRSVSGLAGGSAVNTATTTFAVPPSMKDGTYYLCAITDSGNAVTESNETNNTKCSSGAYQIGPDLSVSSISGSLSGTTFYVSDTGINKGNQPAGAFTVAFYLTTTTTDPAAGTLAGTRSLLELAAGTTSSATTTFAVPSSMKDGTYYLCAMTDSGNTVKEINETNNTKCSSGTYQIGPDLITSGVSASLSGTTFYVTDTEQNIGNAPASGFTVSFYLSLDTGYDSGDYFLGSRNASGLAGGAISTATPQIPLPQGTPSGKYYIIALTDSANVVIETNETNNIKVSSGTVTVP